MNFIFVVVNSLNLLGSTFGASLLGNPELIAKLFNRKSQSQVEREFQIVSINRSDGM